MAILILIIFLLVTSPAWAAVEMEVTFDTTPLGPYTSTNISADFGTIVSGFPNSSLISIVASPDTVPSGSAQGQVVTCKTGRCVRVKYPAGLFGLSASGAQFVRRHSQGYDELFTRYYIFAPVGVQFSGTKQAGKLHAACGRKLTQIGTGCHIISEGMWRGFVVWAFKGASGALTTTWREQGTKEQTISWDDGSPGQVYVTPGVWQQIILHSKMNTPGQCNGIFRAYLDGVLVYQDPCPMYRSATWCVDCSNTGFQFSTFYGGSTSEFAPPTDQWWYFDDFKIATTFDEVVTPPSLPGAPSGQVASAILETSFSLTWTAAVAGTDPIATYRVERCNATADANCTPVEVGTTIPPTVTFANTGLVGSTDYKTRVRARDTAGRDGPYSQELITETAAPPSGDTPPGTPQNFTVSNITSTGFTITWTQGTVGTYALDHYEILLCDETTEPGCVSAPIATTTGLNHAFTALNPEHDYRTRIRVFDTQGNSSPSTTILSAITLPTLDYCDTLNKLQAGFYRGEELIKSMRIMATCSETPTAGDLAAQCARLTSQECQPWTHGYALCDIARRWLGCGIAPVSGSEKTADCAVMETACQPATKDYIGCVTLKDIMQCGTP